MNREVGDSFFLGRNQCIEQMEAVDFRFQLIIEHRFLNDVVRVHDDNGAGDACFTQFGPSSAAATAGNLHDAPAMFWQSRMIRLRSGSLHHTDHFRLGWPEHGR